MPPVVALQLGSASLANVPLVVPCIDIVAILVVTELIFHSIVILFISFRLK